MRSGWFPFYSVRVQRDPIPFLWLSAKIVCRSQSSLAAARADNFYYPPEWSPKKVRHTAQFDFCCASCIAMFSCGGGFTFFIRKFLVGCRRWLIKHPILIVLGLLEQVPWAACLTGKSEEAGSGYSDYKVITSVSLISLEFLEFALIVFFFCA